MQVRYLKVCFIWSLLFSYSLISLLMAEELPEFITQLPACYVDKDLQHNLDEGFYTFPLFYTITNRSSVNEQYNCIANNTPDLIFEPSQDYSILPSRDGMWVNYMAEIKPNQTRVFFLLLDSCIAFHADTLMKRVPVTFTWKGQRWEIEVLDRKVVSVKKLEPKANGSSAKSSQAEPVNKMFTFSIAVSCPDEFQQQYQAQENIIGSQVLPIFVIFKSLLSNPQPFPINSSSIRPDITPGDGYSVKTGFTTPHGALASELKPGESKLMYFDLTQFMSLNSKDATVVFKLGGRKFQVEIRDNKVISSSETTTP